MDTLNNQDSLTQDLIELAASIQPDTQFVARLEQQIRAAPYKALLPHFRRLQLTALLAAALVGLLISFWSVPALHTLAQAALDSLFNRASGDTATLALNNPSSDTMQVVPNVDQARPIAQFTIREPHPIPAAFSLQAIDVNPAIVEFIYTLPGRELTITEQTRAHGWHDNGLIGSTANVMSVMIGTLTGEYVKGEWILTAMPPAAAVNAIATKSVQWRSDVSWQRLRWQAGDMLYEIIMRGGSSDRPDAYVDMSGMVAIAESMH